MTGAAMWSSPALRWAVPRSCSTLSVRSKRGPGHRPRQFPGLHRQPLAIEATRIFKDTDPDCFDEDTRALLAQGIDPIQFPGLQVSVTSDESRMINADRVPKVIISASGMCEAGRIRHHLKHNLWRPECTILLWAIRPWERWAAP